jgi:methionyl-tRNA synthetase
VTWIGELMSRLKGKNYTVWFYWIYLGYKRMGVTWKEWEPYWKDQDTKLVHFIGKDNIFFTALFSCDVKSRRKLYFRQCACKWVLELRR